MKLQLISDLHTEFSTDPVAFTESIEFEPKLDFLVVAGDQVVLARQGLREMRGSFHVLGQKAKHVLYVIGNHEYYGGDAASTEFKLRSLLPSNVHWLQNSDITLDGVHFYGGALWFNMTNDPMTNFYKGNMADFSVIQGLEKWVYEDNRQFTANGLKLITKGTIVISHHLPHPRSIAPQYIGSVLNQWFMSDQSQIIYENRPRIWLHGHTHIACEYQIEDTHVVCNPHGYPHERMGAPYPPVVLEI
jgi:predicted phosphodiesterase